MSSSSSGRTLSALLSAALVLATASRSAVAGEPTNADRASARDLFLAGMELRERGEHAGALLRFRECYAFLPTPITALELGRSYMLVGKLVEARAKLVEAARMPPKATESIDAKKARVEAEKLAEAVAARLASLTLKVTGASAGAGVIVKLDDQSISHDALGAPRKVNPGRHRIVASREGGPERGFDLELKEGEAREVLIDVPLLPVSRSGDAENTTRQLPRDAASRGTTRGANTWAYVGFGFAGSALIVGTVTGLMASSKRSSMNDKCTDGHCPPEYRDDVDTYHRLTTLSTVSFVAAGVGAAVGVIAILSAPGDEGERTAHVKPWVGIGAAGLTGRF